MNVEIHVDGGARGNPGPAAAGVVIRDRDQMTLLHEGGYFLGVLTNNAAEYQGLIRALEFAVQLGARDVITYSDSQLMVRQITGVYQVKSPALKPLCKQACQLLSRFDDWKITHVYRDQNQRADELANMAMDARKDIILTTTSSDGYSSGSGNQKQEDQATPQLPRVGGTDESGQEKPSLNWNATLLRDSGVTCPSHCAAGREYRFGPGTPTGMCLHGAWAVMGEIFADKGKTGDKNDTVVACGLCGVSIQITQRRDGPGSSS